MAFSKKGMNQQQKSGTLYLLVEKKKKKEEEKEKNYLPSDEGLSGICSSN